MALVLKVMYWENSATVVREVTMGDTAKMDDDIQMPKINVIFMIFSTKVAGQDTRVYEKQEFDNYQVTLDQPQNISSMFAFDNEDGGWFRHTNPLAVDGYTKPFGYPGLLPWSKANFISWIFTGVQLTQAEWDGTLAERTALR